MSYKSATHAIYRGVVFRVGVRKKRVSNDCTERWVTARVKGFEPSLIDDERKEQYVDTKTINGQEVEYVPSMPGITPGELRDLSVTERRRIREDGVRDLSKVILGGDKMTQLISISIYTIRDTMLGYTPPSTSTDVSDVVERLKAAVDRFYEDEYVFNNGPDELLHGLVQASVEHGEIGEETGVNLHADTKTIETELDALTA